MLMREERWHRAYASTPRAAPGIDAGLRAYMRAFAVPLVLLAAIGAALMLVVGFARLT